MKKLYKIKIINLISILLLCFYLVTNAIYYIPFFEKFNIQHVAKIMHIKGIIIVVINISIAVWLFFDARKNKQNPFIWSFLALPFGLIALFTYYWRLIYLKMNKHDE